jgi:hypothetical protein
MRLFLTECGFCFWRREYQVSLRLPNRRWKVKAWILHERLVITWLNVIRLRRLCYLAFGCHLVSTHLGPKFNVAVISHGGSRGRYGDLYTADLYNMPAAIILA